jgi:hypothetical protein
MRKILIVGSGQSGLQLALSLLSHGYDVSVMSVRTPEEIRNGRIMSTQAMFDRALQMERAYELNLWEEQAPKARGLQVTLSMPPGTCALKVDAPLDAFAQSVDQRIKMAGWLELFEDKGGKLVIHGATTADLDGLTRLYDLVIVAAGRGELVELFDRDPGRSPYTTPQRSLSVVYVHGMAPRAELDEPYIGFDAVPGFGELFTIPALTLSGPCDVLFWESVLNGPLDCWDDRPTPAEHLQRVLDLMRQYVPWQYERCAKVELTDERASLIGAFTPVVRHPVGELPSGGAVLGMADVVVANDPITGQGSNSAAKCASAYLNAILEREDRPFDRAWMQAAFDTYWAEAQHITNWTNAMLQPLPEHVQQILGTAAGNRTVAARFANGFSDPRDFQHWLMDPDKASQYLASVSSER